MKPSHGHDMTIVNGISRIGYMSGGKAALWNDETMADTLTGRGVAFHRSQREAALLFVLRHARYPRAAVAPPPLQPRHPDGPSRQRHRRAGLVRRETGAGARTARLAPEHAHRLYQRQRRGGGRRLPGRSGREAGLASSEWTPARRQILELRGRHARSDDRALAGARQTGRLRCPGFACRPASVVRAVDGSRSAAGRRSGQRERAGSAAWANPGREGNSWSSRPAISRCGMEPGSTFRRATVRRSKRIPTPRWVPTPRRSSTTSRRISAKPRISPAQHPAKVTEMAEKLQRIQGASAAPVHGSDTASGSAW